jgi:hypothetical protein
MQLFLQDLLWGSFAQLGLVGLYSQRWREYRSSESIVKRHLVANVVAGVLFYVGAILLLNFFLPGFYDKHAYLILPVGAAFLIYLYALNVTLYYQSLSSESAPVSLNVSDQRVLLSEKMIFSFIGSTTILTFSLLDDSDKVIHSKTISNMVGNEFGYDRVYTAMVDDQSYLLINNMGKKTYFNISAQSGEIHLTNLTTEPPNADWKFCRFG